MHNWTVDVGITGIGCRVAYGVGRDVFLAGDHGRESGITAVNGVDPEHWPTLRSRAWYPTMRWRRRKRT
jgi:hypothetical protein